MHDGARGAERFFSDAAPALPVHAARADEYEYSAFKHYLCWTDTTLPAAAFLVLFCARAVFFGAPFFLPSSPKREREERKPRRAQARRRYWRRS